MEDPIILPNIPFTNPEAHTALQLLHPCSSTDEDDIDESIDDEEGDDTVTEEEEDDINEVEHTDEELEEENGDDNTLLQFNDCSATTSSSMPSLPFTVGWGRGSRSSIPILSGPTSAPVEYSSAPTFEKQQSDSCIAKQVSNGDSEIPTTTSPSPTSTPADSHSVPTSEKQQCDSLISKQLNENDRRQITYTRSKTTNGYHYPISHFKKPFNETIDFSFHASTTKIVFDLSNGYQRALQTLTINHILNEPTRNYPDIWSFCLNSRTTRFYYLYDFKSQLLHSSEPIATPQTCISPCTLFNQDSLFWLVFDRRPTFNEKIFNTELIPVKNEPTIVTNMTIVSRIRFFHAVHVLFSYGALTSMNEYYYHPEYNFVKQNEWTITFRPKRFELERLDDKRIDQDKNVQKIFRRSVLPADLIDRTAIFTVHRLGFSVYICTKSNLHEYKHIVSTGENGHQTNRISSHNTDCPIFSTICLHASVKTNPKYRRVNNDDRYSALDQVKYLFKYLLDFFYSNKISVCFTSIKSNLGCLTNLSILTNHLKTPIQIYAFTMLKHVGYAIEQKLYQRQKPFFDQLHELSKDDDDKFYRLCLHLFRRATEYHFLNLEKELEEADREYKNQLEQCKTLNEKMATILSPPRANYAYVPSIRVTPTTILVQPLKLVKLHRVLREKNFGDPMSFALVEIRDEANKALYARDFRSLRHKFEMILSEGININKRRYRYLHHSMSQVKEKQFWFLDQRYSLEDVLCWMGNFDNERVIAKHAARIAQCFTSTEPSIRIPSEHVKYVADIETEDKQYCFTDGVGTLSQAYFKQVQKALGRRYMPSVLQIRYGGCKGTVSIDPRLDDKEHQLILRHSMLKFTTDHDQLEICKISSPRPLYLNRQAILLLSNRCVPDSHFLVLQHENHLWLVQALLCSSVAFELLNERVGSMYFHFRRIANSFNLVEEPFFLQLLITSGHDCVSKFQQRAKIKTAKNKARNMFGIVDEYGVLDYGEVFIQYSHINDEKLDTNEKPPPDPPTILDNVRVAITKNPCHHPGDLRTFIAVNKPELKDLVDVVVFPQKGPRPHPNEISGSDLDGDEYAVIWGPDLVPTTENEEPYNYDSQEKPIKHDGPIERSNIINIVLDIAAQNLTGDMSNLHLALADCLGTNHEDVLTLAGFISQELDAPKTGKHPITNEGLNQYRDKLQNRYPDFMMKEQYKSYSSKKIIGQLYRSARRAIIRWHKAACTHCSLRHLQTALLDDEGITDDNLSSTLKASSFSQRQSIDNSLNRHEPSLKLDPSIQHPHCKDQEKWARNLFSTYRENLKNIISVFNYQDEIDLFCRCESLDQLSSGKQDLNISAGLELQRLIETTRRHFYYDFDQLESNPQYSPLHKQPCTRNRDCEYCMEIKLARAAACYYVCYSQAARQSTKARSRILSFPWLFGELLCRLKEKNLNCYHHFSLSKYIVIGRAMRNLAKDIIEKKELKLKIFLSSYAEQQNGQIYIRSIHSTRESNDYLFKRNIIEHDQATENLPLTQILFIEIMNYWIERQKIFGEVFNVTDKKPLIPEICWHQLLLKFISTKTDTEHFQQYKIVFQTKNNPIMLERYTEYIKQEISILKNEFDSLMYKYSIDIIRICFQIAREHRSNEYACLSDYLILGLQAIGIEKELNDLPIDKDT